MLLNIERLNIWADCSIVLREFVGFQRRIDNWNQTRPEQRLFHDMTIASANILRDARVLITGGAGLVGSQLTDQLIRAGTREVVIYDDMSRSSLANIREALSQGQVKLVQHDIRNRSELTRAMTGVDILFHLASIRMPQCAEEPRLAMEVMVDGTFNVLEAAAAAPIKKVVAASSASIYGMADRIPISEDQHPYHNTTVYGAAKIFTEALLASFRDMYGLDYVVLRPFNIYGPRMNIDGPHTEVLVRWLERISRGLPPIIFGDGNQSMDFIYVEDVARAFILAATSNVSGESFNVATGVETTLKQLAQSILAAMGSSLEIEFGPQRNLAPVARSFGDTRKAAKYLGFTAEVPLTKGLQRLVAWWREQQQTARSAS
jgi:UDP-glucose 4-epimerase